MKKFEIRLRKLGVYIFALMGVLVLLIDIALVAPGILVSLSPKYDELRWAAWVLLAIIFSPGVALTFYMFRLGGRIIQTDSGEKFKTPPVDHIIIFYIYATPIWITLLLKLAIFLIFLLPFFPFFDSIDVLLNSLPRGVNLLISFIIMFGWLFAYAYIDDKIHHFLMETLRNRFADKPILWTTHRGIGVSGIGELPWASLESAQLMRFRTVNFLQLKVKDAPLEFQLASDPLFGVSVNLARIIDAPNDILRRLLADKESMTGTGACP